MHQWGSHKTCQKLMKFPHTDKHTSCMHTQVEAMVGRQYINFLS